MGLPLECHHPLPVMTRTRTQAKNLRLKLSRWAQVTIPAPPPPPLHCRHLSTPPSIQESALPPLPPHPPLTTLTFKAPVSTAPSLGTLLVCISTRTFTPLAGLLPHRLSTAWPWHHLHTVLPLAGSSLSTQHSPGLEGAETHQKFSHTGKNFNDYSDWNRTVACFNEF